MYEAPILDSSPMSNKKQLPLHNHIPRASHTYHPMIYNLRPYNHSFQLTTHENTSHNHNLNPASLSLPSRHKPQVTPNPKDRNFQPLRPIHIPDQAAPSPPVQPTVDPTPGLHFPRTLGSKAKATR
ncbi:hypothetical protein BO86DRAFT_197859 [Aspergillus japonicus CBS 114.51]|uniref:Uncharacterized protein n=2 Tax=Aspergillus TaxID=5052 RepID=A0A2V5GPU5_ASPV1|nr:hypothetical protein BO86DRAFT_197859 [Aspergillus japonicus CBS 114.51]PYI12888.1 hypothetical protein BO99DRAFT_79698 [Aspergillus violaceofuscus CBS 115571]RAH78145.1 hypothetical protein BO86DRAFT_197859 [Aspergillus japonicus CBS 114.51]